MPRVPYEPYPTEQPQGGSERVSVSTPGAAFGENIGQALQNLGSTTQHVGDELFTRAIALQELRNDADARDAQTDFATQVALMHEKWKSDNMGKKASDTLPQFLDQQAQLRENIGSRLTAPMARKRYDADTLPFLQRNIFSAAQHANTENKNYNMGAAAGTVEMAKNNLTDPKDEKEVSQNLDTIKAAVIHQGDMDGWAPEKTAARIQIETSKLRLNQISRIGLTDPSYAFDVLKKAETNKEMDPTDARAAEAYLRTQNRAIAGDLLAKDIYKEGGSLEEMEKKAEARAPALAHGDDVEFTRHVINGITRYQLIENKEVQQQKHTDEQTVLDFIHKNNPTTERELMADPVAGAAVHAVQAHGGYPHGVQSLIDANVNDRNNQQNDANYEALRGMSIRNRAGFLNTTAQDLHNIQMSKVQRADILQMRKKMIAEPIDDPRVSQALKALRQTHDQELRDLGVFKEPAPNASKAVIDNYDKFLGGLSVALDQWAADNPGRPRPTPEEFEKDIAKPLIKVHTEPGMFGITGYGIFGNDVGTFNQSIPKEVFEKARASMNRDAEAAGIAGDFTDKEIAREVFRQQWKELHAKEKSSSGGTSTKP